MACMCMYIHCVFEYIHCKYYNIVYTWCALFVYRVVGLWREDLAKTNAKAAQSLADPTEYENLFPELKQALQAEQFLKRERNSLLPASNFTSAPVNLTLSLSLSLSLPPYTHTHTHTHTHSHTHSNCWSLCFCLRILLSVMCLRSLLRQSQPRPLHPVLQNKSPNPQEENSHHLSHHRDKWMM